MLRLMGIKEREGQGDREREIVARGRKKERGKEMQRGKKRKEERG